MYQECPLGFIEWNEKSIWANKKISVAYYEAILAEEHRKFYEAMLENNQNHNVELSWFITHKQNDSKQES